MSAVEGIASISINYQEYENTLTANTSKLKRKYF